MIHKVRQLIGRQENAQQIIKNVLWLFMENVLRLVTALVVSAWIARHLGVDDYGRLKSVVTLLLMFQSALRIGMGEVLVREFIKRPDERPSLLSSAFVLRFVLSVLALPLMPLVMGWLEPEDPLLAELMTIASVSVLFLAFEVIDYWFQSIVQVKYVVWARNAALLISSAIRLILIWQGAPLFVFVIMVVGEYVFLSVGLMIVYWRMQAPPLFGRVRLDYIRQLLRDGSPLILTGLAVTAFMRVDQLMLISMLPVEIASYEVGLYAAAASLSEVWFFVPVSILNSLFPMIVAAYESDNSTYQQRVQRIMRFLTLISLVFALSVTLLSRVIIGVLFGADYAPSALLLSVLVWSSVFISMTNMLARLMTIENHLHYTAMVTTAGAIINILLNLWLIPRMGTMGSAIATLLSYVLVGYVGAFVVPSKIPLGWMQTKALLWPNPLSKQ